MAQHLRDRIHEMTDKQLLQIIHGDPDNYTPEAVTLAKDEMQSRGGIGHAKKRIEEKAAPKPRGDFLCVICGFGSQADRGARPSLQFRAINQRAGTRAPRELVVICPRCNADYQLSWSAWLVPLSTDSGKRCCACCRLVSDKVKKITVEKKTSLFEKGFGPMAAGISAPDSPFWDLLVRRHFVSASDINRAWRTQVSRGTNQMFLCDHCSAVAESFVARTESITLERPLCWFCEKRVAMQNCGIEIDLATRSGAPLMIREAGESRSFCGQLPVCGLCQKMLFWTTLPAVIAGVLAGISFIIYSVREFGHEVIGMSFLLSFVIGFFVFGVGYVLFHLVRRVAKIKKSRESFLTSPEAQIFYEEGLQVDAHHW